MQSAKTRIRGSHLLVVAVLLIPLQLVCSATPFDMGTIPGPTAPATQLAMVTQPPASAETGTVLTPSPAVGLRDATNNTVAQAGVNVTVAIASGGGTLAGTLTVATDASGVATFPGLSIAGTAGARVLSFSAASLTAASSSAISITVPPPPPPTATQLAMVTQPPASAETGTVLTPSPAVSLRDASNGAVTQAGVNVTVAIASGGGTLSGTLTVATDASGVATFPGLSIAGTAGSRVLSFSAASLTAATSNAIAITVPPPPGGAILFQEDFEDANLASRGWYDLAGVTITTLEHAPGSTASAQFRFTPGATNPTFRGGRHKFTATSSVYLRYHVKYSTTWIGSGSTDSHHEIYFQSSLDGDFNGPANAWLTLYVEQNYQQNGGRPRIAMQDNRAINTTMGALPNNLVGVTEQRSTSGCNGLVETNIQSGCFLNGANWYNDKGLLGPVVFQPNPGPGYKSDWNLVEAYFQLNTVTNGTAQQNGIMRYWFNGQLIIDRSDILFRTAARETLQINQLLMAPFIGDGSPADQSIYVDNLVVRTARP